MNDKTDNPNNFASMEDFHKVAMSEAFDGIEAFENEIRPLVRQIHALCSKHGLPFFLSVVVKNDPEEENFQTVNSLSFCGPERTPVNFVAINQLSKAEVGEAMAVSQALHLFAEAKKATGLDALNVTKPHLHVVH